MFSSEETPDVPAVSSSPQSMASALVPPNQRPIDVLSTPNLVTQPLSPASGHSPVPESLQSSVESSLQSQLTVDSFQRNVSLHPDTEKPAKSGGVFKSLIQSFTEKRYTYSNTSSYNTH